MNTVHSGSGRQWRVLTLASATMAALSLSASLAIAAPVFDQPASDFKGRVFSAGAVPGDDAELTGRAFLPGQKVTLSRGGQVLNPDAPVVVDADGGFKATVKIPAGAVPGLHPVVVEAAGPTAAIVFDLKVSPKVDLSGQDRYTLTSEKLVTGLYQVAYSASSDRLFVTSAVGRPPVKESKLLKVNPATLKIDGQIDLPEAQGRTDGHRLAVYGVDVDDSKGTVWVTNTRDNTVAVYSQKDLSLVKQFEPGAAPHARDVIIDAKRSRAYVSTPGKAGVEVFDTGSNTHVKSLEIASLQRDGKFSSMSLALDADAGKLYVVSASNELAIVDTKTDALEKVLPVEGVRSGSGVAVDPKSNRAFVSAQGSDNVAVVDLASGKTLAVTPVGAGSLNVVFDSVSGHAYASNRGADTVTVLDIDGKIVANLPGGSLPNHARADGKGTVYVVNKARGKDDAQGDRITRIVPKK